MNLRKMIQMFRAFRAGAPLGDVVVLKLDALAVASPSCMRKLDQVRGYAPEQNLAALRALAPGTLGREYACFLDANGIEPLVISARVKEQFRDSPYALRYTTTHDLHHVLTGFDTGLAGEAGVLAFNVGQGSAPISRAMLWLVRLIYTLVSPTQALRIWHNVRIGLALGERAELVMAQPLESHFDQSLEQVREKLGIADPRVSGVLRSGRSLLFRLFYPMKMPA